MKRYAPILFLSTFIAYTQAAKPWQPKPSDAPVKPIHARIVKQGLEHQRTGDGHTHAIATFHRFRSLPDASGRYVITTAGDDLRKMRNFDVDGDGDAEDDLVIFHPFDLTRGNPLTPVGPFYDTSVGSQEFYGGLTCYAANLDNDEKGFTEDGMNDGEEGTTRQPRRNWAYFRELAHPYSPFRMYGVWIWQKFDFLNGGDQHRVSFDERSELRHLVMRYHMGMEGFRWVVRNGDRFYISEDVYKGAGDPFGSTGGKIHVCKPLETRWAEYDPHAPYHIDFDADSAQYTDPSFDDVTAVGYYIFKDNLVVGYFGYKWYAFEADAVVHRPNRPSEYIDMTEIKKGDVPAFYMSTCEVPYELWRKVRRLAVYNGWAGPRGYNFKRFGDMGSMDMPDTDDEYLPHNQDEPVTDISFLDAVAWCNALSIQEGRTPCYYVDPEFNEEYREVEKGEIYLTPQPSPTLYVKWDADGYRLPTPAEWQAAFSGQPTDADSAWLEQSPESTRAVGTGDISPNGLYDMIGNVWEMVWTQGDTLPTADYDAFTALGGGLHYPEDPRHYSASAYGDRPFNGHAAIGFRLVRRESDMPRPDQETELDDTVPVWTVRRDLHLPPEPERQGEPPDIEMVSIPDKPWVVGKTEITFAQWKPVCDWAQAHGYTFDSDGEMGSMSYWGFGKNWKPGTHTPDEPVTGITHFDAVIWCNALSEMQNLTPVYYEDETCTDVMKKSYIYRPPQLTLGELGERRDEIAGWGEGFKWLYAKDDADGYRLPTSAEYDVLAMSPGRNHAELLPDNALEIGWLADNSGLRTHPVAQKPANALGLHDIVGNVAEMPGELTDKSSHMGAQRIQPGYAGRYGGGFMDTLTNYGDREFMHGRGLGYPDTGFRVMRYELNR